MAFHIRNLLCLAYTLVSGKDKSESKNIRPRQTYVRSNCPFFIQVVQFKRENVLQSENILIEITEIMSFHWTIIKICRLAAELTKNEMESFGKMLSTLEVKTSIVKGQIEEKNF